MATLEDARMPRLRDKHLALAEKSTELEPVESKEKKSYKPKKKK